MVDDGNWNSYSIWKILPDGNLAKLREIQPSEQSIVNNNLQKAIRSEKVEKTLRLRLIDLSSDNKSTEMTIELPSLFKNDGFILYYCELFQSKDQSLLISSGESKFNNILEIHNFLPTLYQRNISGVQNKSMKFTNQRSLIYSLDPDLNKFRYVIPRPGIISSPIISPDGKTMFFIEQNSSTKLTVWDTLTGEFLREVNLITMPLYDGYGRVEFTPDGKKLVIAESNGQFNERIEPYISIWDVEELRNP